MLASVSYLMEFFLAMDFMGCDSLRDSVEKRILERITKSNCSEVLTFVENRGRLCLEKIAEAAQSQLEDTPVTDEQQQVSVQVYSAVYSVQVYSSRWLRPTGSLSPCSRRRARG